MIRCDKSMRKSKEKCRTPDGRRWRCTGECKECHCALVKDQDGTEHHKHVSLAHPQGKKVNYDEFKAEGQTL